MTNGRTVALLVTGALVLVGAGCATRADDVRADSTTRARAAVPTRSSSAKPPQPVPSARRASSVVVAEPPVMLGLPSGQRVEVSAVGTTASGRLDVPADVGRAGWWRGGSLLGDPFGSTLVAAHVDSRSQGPGPFAELLSVRRGVRVRLSSMHLTQTFEVRSRQLVPQGSLVREAWLFDVSGDRRLTLVTCAPPYDLSRGGYQNLAVVTAVPVSPAEPS